MKSFIKEETNQFWGKKQKLHHGFRKNCLKYWKQRVGMHSKSSAHTLLGFKLILTVQEKTQAEICKRSSGYVNSAKKYPQPGSPDVGLRYGSENSSVGVWLRLEPRLKTHCPRWVWAPMLWNLERRAGLKPRSILNLNIYSAIFSPLMWALWAQVSWPGLWNLLPLVFFWNVDIP